MKHFILPSIILFFSLTLGCAVKNKTDQYKEKLSSTYHIENGQEIKGDEWRVVNELDESGRVIKSRTYLNGELQMCSDDLAKPSDGSLTITNFNGNGTINTINEKVFKNGKETRSNVLNGDGEFVFKVEYKYDSRNRIKQRLISPGQSSVPPKKDYEYDDENHTSTVSTYNLDGTLDSKVAKILNASGEVLKAEEIRYWKGKAYKIINYDYINGNCTSEISSNPDGKIYYKITTNYNRTGTSEIKRTFEPNKDTGDLELVEVTKSKIKY